MALYTWLKFGHLVGLVLLSGGMATQLIAYAGLLRAGTVGELRTWQELPKERLTDGGMGLLILTGLAMAGQSWSFTDGWILAAIGVLAVTIAAAVAGVGPRNTRLKAALAAAGDGAAAAPAELTAPARDPVLHGAMRLQLVALLEIVYLMARKPSGVGILVSLLVAAVAVVAVCWPLVGGRQAAAGSAHLGRARRRRRRIIASIILLAVVGLLPGNAAMVDRQDADATGTSTLPLDGGNIYVRQDGPRDAPATDAFISQGLVGRLIEVPVVGQTAVATSDQRAAPQRIRRGPPHFSSPSSVPCSAVSSDVAERVCLPCPVGKPHCRAVSRRARFMSLATRPGRSIP